MQTDCSQGLMDEKWFTRLADEFIRTRLDEGATGGVAIEELLGYYSVKQVSKEEARRIATTVFERLFCFRSGR